VIEELGHPEKAIRSVYGDESPPKNIYKKLPKERSKLEAEIKEWFVLECPRCSFLRGPFSKGASNRINPYNDHESFSLKKQLRQGINPDFTLTSVDPGKRTMI